MSDRERADVEGDGEGPGPAEANDADESAVATIDEAAAAELDEKTTTGDPEDAPVWDDEYVERVSGRLLHNFDLEKERTVASESFTLYGRMEIESRKQLFHAALNYANHGSTEHLFVARRDGVGVADLEAYVEWAHGLGDAGGGLVVAPPVPWACAAPGWRTLAGGPGQQSQPVDAAERSNDISSPQDGHWGVVSSSTSRSGTRSSQS
jgi:GNAT superfamily N-acetyltransferase